MRNFELIESILWSAEPFLPSSLCRASSIRIDDFIFAAGETRRYCLKDSISWEQHYFLLDRHMERIRKSAAFFSFTFRHDFILNELERLHDMFMSGGCAGVDGNVKIRLLSAEDGSISIEYVPLSQVRSLPVCFDISSMMPQEEPAMLAHKTTFRETFDRELERAMASGLFDTVFVNGREEITQGCITNVFASLNVRGTPLITPRLESGLLPGTLRAELVSLGLAVEGSLTENMLRHAHAVYLGNSVRGLVPAVLINNVSMMDISQKNDYMSRK